MTSSGFSNIGDRCTSAAEQRLGGDEEDHCIICMDSFQEKITLKCSHSFCSSCIDSFFKIKPACPVCNSFHGTYEGTQPRDGIMTVRRNRQCLPGYEEGNGHITIDYHFPAGVQGVRFIVAYVYFICDADGLYFIAELKVSIDIVPLLT